SPQIRKAVTAAASPEPASERAVPVRSEELSRAAMGARIGADCAGANLGKPRAPPRLALGQASAARRTPGHDARDTETEARVRDHAAHGRDLLRRPPLDDRRSLRELSRVP